MKPTTSPQAASAAAMTKTTTLERVARAMHAEFNESGRGDYACEWDDPMASRDHFLDQARAALQALRQVDDETVEAMESELWSVCESWEGPKTEDTKRAFTAAIDHILGQEP